jgi:osmotically-inducible protein OsmY
MTQADLAQKARAALEADTRINLTLHPLRIEATPDDAVVLDGEVADIAVRKIALSVAAGVPGVRGVVDRLRVFVAEPRGDGAIRDSLVKFIESESEFSNCTLRTRVEGRIAVAHDAGPDAWCDVEAEIHAGVITLNGKVISLSHKRVLGVLAWWTPGCREVVNGIAVVPDEEDSDDEIVDAVRLVLEMDPMLKAETVSARCRDAVVTLEGAVRTEEGRHQAELDAWYVFGVERVVNRLSVQR